MFDLTFRNSKNFKTLFLSNVSVLIENISSLQGFLINMVNWRYKGHIPEVAYEYISLKAKEWMLTAMLWTGSGASDLTLQLLNRNFEALIVKCKIISC